MNIIPQCYNKLMNKPFDIWTAVVMIVHSSELDSILETCVSDVHHSLVSRWSTDSQSCIYNLDWLQSYCSGFYQQKRKSMNTHKIFTREGNA